MGCVTDTTEEGTIATWKRVRRMISWYFNLSVLPDIWDAVA